MNWYTLATLLISSGVAPWLATKGLSLDPSHQAWLTALLVAAPSATAHYLESKFKSGAAVPPAVVKITTLFCVLGIVASAPYLSGCSTLRGVFGGNNATVAQIAVEYATAKVIEVGKTPTERTVRAQQIKAIATQVDTIAKSDSTTIAALEAVVSAKLVTLHLQPSDTLLANALLVAVVNELNGKVSTGVLSPSDILLLDKVLGWVNLSAAMYGA